MTLNAFGKRRQLLFWSTVILLAAANALPMLSWYVGTAQTARWLEMIWASALVAGLVGAAMFVKAWFRREEGEVRKSDRYLELAVVCLLAVCSSIVAFTFLRLLWAVDSAAEAVRALHGLSR